MKLSTNSAALAKEEPERTKLNVVSGQYVLLLSDKVLKNIILNYVNIHLHLNFLNFMIKLQQNI